MVTLDEPSKVPKTYTVRIATGYSDYVVLGDTVFDEGDRTWEETLPVDLVDMHGLQFFDPDWRVAFTAVVDFDAPWIDT